MALIKADFALCEPVYFMNLVISLSYSEIKSSLSLPPPLPLCPSLETQAQHESFLL